MSSSQTQRQERLQARLRGTGNAAFTGAFSFQLPQEPSAPTLLHPPLPGTRESTSRRQTPKQSPEQSPKQTHGRIPRQTPPTRALPRLTRYGIEASTNRTALASSQLSVASRMEKQRRQRQSVWGSTTQKRKQSDITIDSDLDTQRERTHTEITAPDSNTLNNLHFPPAAATRAVTPVATITNVTLLTRGRRTSKHSPDQPFILQAGGDTRPYEPVGKSHAAKFTSPQWDISLIGLKDEIRDYWDDDGVTPKATSGVLGDVEDEIMEVSGSPNVKGQESGKPAVGDRCKYVQQDPVEESSFSVVIARSPKRKKQRKESPEADHNSAEEEVYGKGNGPVENPALEAQLSPQVIAREPSCKQQRPPLIPTNREPQQQPSQQKRTVEITVQRLPKSRKDIKYIPDIPITPLEVLSQIFKQMFKKQYETLDSSAEKWALEVFADEVEVRLLDHIDALNATIQASRELRRYTRLKQQNCDELMTLRQELGQIELEIDEVRRKHERESSESKRKHSISQHLDSIAATLELRKARMEAMSDQPAQLEGQVDLLLRKLAREVTSPGLQSHGQRKRINKGRGQIGLIGDGDVDDDNEGELDHTGDGDRDANNQEQQEEMAQSGDGLAAGSILERVKGFNRFLEKMEKVILEASSRSH